MKAVFEIEAPKSCATCRLMREERSIEGDYVCAATGEIYYALYMLDRAPDCPLKILPENCEIPGNMSFEKVMDLIKKHPSESDVREVIKDVADFYAAKKKDGIK